MVSKFYKIYNNRMQIISSLIIIVNISILSRMFFIQSFKSIELRNKTREIGITKRTMGGKRGYIYDRAGEVLAETINKYTFWVDTRQHFERDKIIDLFSSTFNKPKYIYRKLLDQKKPYVKLEQGLLRMDCAPILSKIKRIKGLQYDIIESRYYPYNSLASQVVGYVDLDNKGQLGIERQFDHILKGNTVQRIYNRSANGSISESLLNSQPVIENGIDIYLTLDVKIQAILLNALKKGLKKSKAYSASGIVVDPFSGEILAMASVPDFNPNNYKQYSIANFLNRTISLSYEPGSTFKLIAMASILESGMYELEDEVYCEEGQYHILPNKSIHDHEPYGSLSISEIFIHSSNIGLAKLVDQLGAKHIYNYARKFGFGVKTDIPLPSEESGILRPYSDWSRLSGPSISMGQEISVNTLQIALAYSSVANGGYLPKARIITNMNGKGYGEKKFESLPLRKVVSKNTSTLLLEMMEKVVNHGTATKARIPGYRIGGKTGTAEKFIDGHYSKKDFISSFVAIFPIDAPKYVCIISVDSPQYGYHWGNETAAPIVKDIIERLIINNNVYPDQFRKNDYVQRKTNTNIPHLNISDQNPSDNQLKMPNFIGKTLKQSIKEAKLIGFKIKPIGASGRVVWQSVKPGRQVPSDIVCQINLESM